MFNRDANATNVTFEQRVAKLREAVEAKKRAAMTEQEQFIADHIAEHPEDLLSEADLAGEGDAPKRYTRDFQDEIKQLSHRDVMARFGDPAKNHAAGPDRRGLFRCPEQGHQDNNPSARWDRDNGYKTWRCWSGTCDKTGDKLAFIGAVRGYWSATLPGNGWNNFGRFIEELKFELGYELAGQDEDWGDAVDEEGEAVSSDAPATPDTHPQPVEDVASGQMGTVSDPPDDGDEPGDIDDEDEEDYDSALPELDIEGLLPPGDSFLREYVYQLGRIDCPAPFAFMAGMTAISMAAGRDIALKSRKGDTFGNIFTLLIGNAGQGKGTAMKALARTVKVVFPFDEEPALHGQTELGARAIRLPGSREAIIDAITQIIHNIKPGDPFYTRTRAANYRLPATKAMVKGQHYSARTLIYVEEYEEIVSKNAGGRGGVKDTFHDFFDNAEDVERNSLTHGQGLAYKPYVCLISGSTPVRIRGQLSREDVYGGWLSRNLPIYAKPVRPDHTKMPESPDYSLAHQQLAGIRRFVEGKLTDPVVQQLGQYVIPFDNWVGSAWDKYNKALDRYWDLEQDNEVFSRLGHHLVRFVLLFMLNNRTDKVSDAEIDPALKLIDYIISCYQQLMGVASQSEMSQTMERVLGRIQQIEKKTKLPTSAPHLWKTWGRFQGKHFDREAFDEAIYRLTRVSGMRAVERCQLRGARGPASDQGLTLNLEQYRGNPRVLPLGEVAWGKGPVIK